jgi:hypothetical protein
MHHGTSVPEPVGGNVRGRRQCDSKKDEQMRRADARMAKAQQSFAACLYVKRHKRGHR